MESEPGAAWLRRRAGRPVGEPGRFEGFEALEARVLLGADQPDFNEVFNNPSPQPAELITLNGAGEGSASGEISPAGDTDMFRFTAPASEFVTVWADAINPASGLNSHVAVYRRNDDGTLNNPVLVASGGNNGTVTGGTITDGWTGFIAEAGVEYFVRVMSDANMNDPAATGAYVLRVDARPDAFPALNGDGEGTAGGNITLAGDDVVYKVTAGAGAIFDSLMTAVGRANANDFDVRLDVYDASGQRIRSDSSAGFQSDAYTAWRSDRNAVFYVRVRGDQFTLGNPLATGAFNLDIDGAATDVPLDPVTRLGDAGGDAGGTATASYSFVAQGTGLGIIHAMPTGLVPIPDAALHLYDDEGNQIAFNDDLIGLIPQVERQLIGGERYYVVVEDFDDPNAGQFNLYIEANHTFPPTTTVDDHANATDFENATPVVWGSPQDMPNFVDGGLLTDRNKIVVGHGTGRIHNFGDSDLFVFTPPVDMLSAYVDEDLTDDDPPQWRPDRRPGTRLQLFILGEPGSTLTPQVQVLDSNFDVVFPAGGGTNGAVFIAPNNDQPETAAAGMWDPASYPPPEMTLDDYPWIPIAGARGIEVWGGEAHYLRVTGAGKGRYQFVIMADALPENPDTGGVYEDNNSEISETPNAGDWLQAAELILDFGTGDTLANGQASGTYDTGVNRSAFFERVYAFGDASAPDLAPGFNPGATGTNGLIILQESGLAAIESIEDTDLYQFSAPFDGTVEIRINTTALEDWFVEFAATTEPEDTDDPASEPRDPADVLIEPDARTKIYNSLLDSALRIFNFDREEIAFNDENAAMVGQTQEATVGSFTRTFHRRDARVVFEVQRGERYFIQVESGQRAAFLAGHHDQIDWRGALGSYELIINAMPNLDFVDDHVNTNTADIDNPQATPFPVGQTPGSGENGRGSVSGQIDHNSFNPVDTDLFHYVAPADGQVTLTLSPTGGTLAPRLDVYNQNGLLIGSRVSAAGQPATLAVSVTQGDRLYLSVAGAGGTEGTYVLEADGNAFVDDHASRPDFAGATELVVRDFSGVALADGVLEFAGDSDIYRFEANDFADLAGDGLIQATVTRTSGLFEPVVQIYEVQFDRTNTDFPATVAGATHPVLVRIGADLSGGGAVAQATFSITAPPRESSLADQSGNTYNFYYVVVSAAGGAAKGAYDLVLSNFTKSDDHPDAGEYEFVELDDDSTPSVVALDSATGDGDGAGELEVSGDTDLFQFTAPGTGQARVSVVSPADSELLVRMRVFRLVEVDGDGTFVVEPVTDLVSGQQFRDAPDVETSTARFTFGVVRAGVYYVLVEGRTGGVIKSADTGHYTVNVNAPALDDHANEGEWDHATVITLSRFTGDGVDTGIIHQDFQIDTDLFTFTSLVPTNFAITLDTPAGGFTGLLRLFDADGNEIGVPVVDNDANDQDPNVGRLRRRLNVGAPDEKYFVLVSAASSSFLPGNYTLTITGDAPPPGPDDHADEFEWADATLIPLSPYTGDGTAPGATPGVSPRLEEAGDTDLFTFIPRAGSEERPHPVFIQALAPEGSPLGLTLRVYDEDHNLVANLATPVAGIAAAYEFEVTEAGRQYFVVVDGLGSGTGEYTLNIDTAPETFFLYFPEGFANSNIREYVTINNPNAFDVTYSVKIRYQNEGLGEVTIVDSATLAAGRRGGVTLSNGPLGRAPGVVANRAYAIIIESDGPLGATIAHYDFGASLGESFTPVTSDTWSFARGQRFHGEVEDFLVFYNPNPHAVVVTLTAYRGGAAVATLTTTVQGMRRGGFAFDNENTLPVGEFSFVVTSAPVNPANAPDDIGIVASLSHYDLANTTGYAVLGDPTGGNDEGVVPAVTHGAGRTGEVTFFNPGASAVAVTLQVAYVRAALPSFAKVITVPARSSITLDGFQIGIAAGQPAGIRYSATAPIVVLASERRGSVDADATGAVNQVASEYFFGDAFINSERAGTIYLETLNFFNPTNSTLPISVRLDYFDGSTIEQTVTVGPGRFGFLDVHAIGEILERGGNNFFSIRLSAPAPFAATFTHYDLFLGGGWGTGGAPFGLLTDIGLLMA